MEGRVQILPEKELPARPLELFACPAHIYTGYLATQLMARSPECTLHTTIQLEQCRKRLQVRLSLVPGPFSLYASMEGEGLGGLVMCGDIR